MKSKLLSEEQLKYIRDAAIRERARPDEDVFLLLDHIQELHRLHSCTHHWEYHFEVGFVCGKCGLERNRR